jgi:hypothetical protein
VFLRSDKHAAGGLADLGSIDPVAVREQMERMVAHPLFSRSKRYPGFLRCIVENALSDSPEHLKERTLGIEVFGRKPDYDTNQDPVVRTTAGDMRLRIAQYYHEGGHEAEMRIELPAGSYFPEFHAPVSAPIAVETAIAQKSIRLRLLASMAFVGLIAVAIAIRGFMVHAGAPENQLDEFWNPVLNAAAPVLIATGGCPGNEEVAPPIDVPPTGWKGAPKFGPCDPLAISFTDALAMSTIAGVVRSKGKLSELRKAYSVSLSDMRNRPVVLIGAFNNPWTTHFCATMRFSFKYDGQSQLSEIVDKSNPSEHWGIPIYWQALPVGEVTKDYALVSREMDPTTGQILVVAGGIGAYGTVAASEFLSNPKYIKTLASQAPQGWSTKNLQVVLETDVINGSSGQPRIVASQFW